MRYILWSEALVSLLCCYWKHIFQASVRPYAESRGLNLLPVCPVDGRVSLGHEWVAEDHQARDRGEERQAGLVRGFDLMSLGLIGKNIAHLEKQNSLSSVRVKLIHMSHTASSRVSFSFCSHWNHSVHLQSEIWTEKFSVPRRGVQRSVLTPPGPHCI